MVKCSFELKPQELRLEEDARLLDIRGHKISHLESQLKNIVYGTTKGKDILPYSQQFR